MKELTGYFKRIYEGKPLQGYIHSCSELIECVHSIGFLPLLDGGIPGYSAESMMAEECRYTVFADGSWEWPLWEWKGAVVRDGGCVYGKFFAGKAGFISLDWWPDFFNWRRSQHPSPEENTIEDVILSTLRANDSLVTRDLRAACDFTGKNMRSKFDTYITRLQMGCRIVTEDFVYPRDKHGREYGFGWSLLTTPEVFPGKEACQCDMTSEQSYQRMFEHLTNLLPEENVFQIKKLLK